MTDSKVVGFLCALVISIGIFGAGYSIGKNLFLSRLLNRTVTVKGLAEQDIVSDLGVWEINYREVGNDLVQLNQRLQHDQEVVTAFLTELGFTQAEISRAALRVEDRLANVYQATTPNENNQRYVVTSGLRVRSAKVDLIAQASQVTDKLLQQGILLAFDVSSVSPNPSFYYTQLDAIRPKMLAQATESARAVAEQFAKDSRSRLAGIQRASQGQFQIMNRDSSVDYGDNAAGSIKKKVRLVSTIDYRLR